MFWSSQGSSLIVSLVRGVPNDSFKPNLLRYSFGVAGKACHTKASTTQVGLTQALGAYGRCIANQ
jgi:hypothetical protein